MDKIRIGIIGNGIIANNHLAEYSKMPDVEIIALCDIDEKQMNSTGDQYGVANRYVSIRKLLERDDIQAVDVCLHNNLHTPVVIAALEAGKDVYCEKPMAGSYMDALHMVQAMEQTGRKLHIQLAFIYGKEAKAAKRLIDAGRLGQIYHMRSYGWRRRGRPYVDGYATKEFVNSATSAGGALFDMGVYHISQLLYFSGLPVLERIVGNTYAKLPMNEKRREISGFNVEELGCGYATFRNNMTLDILESWAVHMGEFPGSMIFGDTGGISLSPFKYHFMQDDMEFTASADLTAMDYRDHNVYAENAVYDSSQIHWIAALQGKCELLPTAKIALDTQLVQEGIYISEKLGREVTADEIRALSVSKAVTIPNL